MFYDFGIFINKKDMQIPTTDKTEVLIMRISKKHLQCLQSLIKNSKFGKNKSEIIRKLIEMGVNQSKR